MLLFVQVAYKRLDGYGVKTWPRVRIRAVETEKDLLAEANLEVGLGGPIDEIRTLPSRRWTLSAYVYYEVGRVT